VTDQEDFFQGVWEEQLAALDEQGVWTALRHKGSGDPALSDEALGTVSAAWCFDALLDLLHEAGNHGIDFVAGYVLGYSEGLLCGLTFPPARLQTEVYSA